jgi:hypothetical protein
MDPVPDPLLLRKSGSAGNRTQDLWISSQELWPRDHRGGFLCVKYCYIKSEWGLRQQETKKYREEPAPLFCPRSELAWWEAGSYLCLTYGMAGAVSCPHMQDTIAERMTAYLLSRTLCLYVQTKTLTVASYMTVSLHHLQVNGRTRDMLCYVAHHDVRQLLQFVGQLNAVTAKLFLHCRQRLQQTLPTSGIVTCQHTHWLALDARMNDAERIWNEVAMDYIKYYPNEECHLLGCYAMWLS